MLERLHVVTVFDHRRTAEARLLARSVQAFHPDARISAVFLGERCEPLLEGVEVTPLSELLGETWWLSIAQSSPRHLDGIGAAPGLRAALAAGDERVVLLGCELLVTAPLTPLTDATADVVFVAMTERELPDDGLRPDLVVASAAGAVNRRVLAVRSGDAARRLLDGWPAVTLAEMGHHPPELVADSVQRYLDRFASLDDDATVLADPGVAAAYWNLPLRPVTGETEALTAGSQPLRLLDLSGFDPSQPGLPFPEQTRWRPSASPALAGLLDEHGRALQAELRNARPASPYAHDGHGRPLDDMFRGLVRLAVADGALGAPPWTAAGTRDLDRWLAAPGERGAALGLTRYHNAIWEQREDLRASYPHLDGPDGLGYVGWLHTYGPLDHGIPKESLPPWDADRSLRNVPALPWGVNVAGFFRSELGLGEAARLLIAGLDAVTVPALPVQGALVPPTRQNAEFTFTSPNESPYPINIICMNGDTIPVFAREVDDRFFSERHTIALWWWEIIGAFPPDWHDAFAYVDEIWVATEHIYKAIAPHSPKPVLKIPMPVALPRLALKDRASLGMPAEGFIFLYVFDYHSTAARKNPVGLVESFKEVFEPGSGAKLVLKCINADRIPEQHERTMVAIGGHPDISVIDRFVTADDKNAMLAACDCYVSLHRSEGFGLTPAEAMLLGKPVIATRYGGTTDFMSDETAYLVDHQPARVGPGAHPYPPDAMWVEPDREHAARLMRHVFENRAEAREVGARAARYMAAHHAPEIAGRAMRERLEVIYGDVSSSYTAPSVRTTARLEGILERITSAPPAPSNPAKSSLRRVSDRVASPWAAHQRRIDHDLYRSLETLQADVDRLAHDLAARADGHIREERTQNMAALRRVRNQLADQQRWLMSLDTRLQRTVDEHRAVPYMSAPFEAWTDPVAGRVEGFRESRSVDDDEAYRAFEDRFRGTRDRIVELQRPYGRLLQGFAPVLDCGCGRGELLEVLRDAGIEARGVDLDAGMLDIGRAAGFDVELGDATELLRASSPGSLGAVTAMQVIEHMTYQELRAFLQAAREALRGGGRLVVETVNPHMPAAMKGFWLDPTHEHPLFPEVVLELCGEAGFDTGFVFHPTGTGVVEDDRFTVPAFAVVAEAPDVGARERPADHERS